MISIIRALNSVHTIVSGIAPSCKSCCVASSIVIGTDSIDILSVIIIGGRVCGIYGSGMMSRLTCDIS